VKTLDKIMRLAFSFSGRDRQKVIRWQDVSHILRDVKQENLPRENELFYVRKFEDTGFFSDPVQPSEAEQGRSGA
jgi:hypothetical protein